MGNSPKPPSQEALLAKAQTQAFIPPLGGPESLLSRDPLQGLNGPGLTKAFSAGILHAGQSDR